MTAYWLLLLGVALAASPVGWFLLRDPRHVPVDAEWWLRPGGGGIADRTAPTRPGRHR